MIVRSLWSLILFIMLAYSAQAIEYGQMGGRPTNYDPNIPDSQSWFIYNLDPGTAKEDSMTVANLFEDSWVAVIYAADSIKSSSGGFALRQLTEAKEAVGSWVKFYPDPKPEFASKIFEEKKTIDEVCKVSGEDLEKNYGLDGDKIVELNKWCQGKELVEMDLKSGEKKDLLFVITIPKDADVGEHTGGILIQKKGKDESTQGDGSKVMLTTRVGVRIYETVPGEIIKKLNFADFQISKNFDEFYLPWDKIKKEKFNEYLITSAIKNSGNASTDFNEKITIHNIITRKTEALDTREFQVLRGDDFTSSLVWKSPRLAYLNFQKEYRYKNSNGDEQIIQSEIIKKWFIPWRELVIFVFFVLLASGGYVFWRKYQKKYYGGTNWVEYIVKDGETVQSLLKKFSLDWKVFVKTNKIKKPYLLEVGQTVKVPDIEGKSLTQPELPVNTPVTHTEIPAVKVPKKEIIDIDKKESRDELSDEDILNRTELFDSAMKKNDDTEIEIKKVVEPNLDDSEEIIKNDIVDSSLFFSDINFNKKDDSQGDKVQEEVSAATQSKTSRPNTKPLMKNTDIQRPKAVVVEDASVLEKFELEESKRKDNLVAEEDVITILGTKDDIKSYFKWIILGLVLVIIFLLGSVVYLLMGNKKAEKATAQVLVVAQEDKEKTASQEEVPAKEAPQAGAGAEVEKVDPLKMKIEVYNGSGVAGAAGKVKDFLTSKKYESVEAKNYSSDEVEGSTIYYKEEKLKEEAQWLADILKDNDVQAQIKLASTEEEKNADVVIILGK